MNMPDQSKTFKKNLFEFWSSKGVENLKIPQIGGRELDLFHLYRAVCKRGGAEYVSNSKLWKEIVNEFGLPPSCTSASFTLRNHYTKYLLAYEQKYFFGKDDSSAITELAGSRARKQIKLNNEEPHNNNNIHHIINEQDSPVNNKTENNFNSNEKSTSIRNILQEKYRNYENNEGFVYYITIKIFYFYINQARNKFVFIKRENN